MTRARLARLHHDGSLDTTFTPVMNDTVLSVTVQPDGKVLAGGAFTRINGDTGTPPAPGTVISLRERNANEATLTTSAAHSLAIGSQVSVSGAGVGFDGTFTVTAVPSATRFSYSSVGTDVAPTATTAAFSALGTPAGRFVRLQADGSLDGTFALGVGADNLVFAVLLQSDLKVVLAGDFSTLNSAVRGRIARLNGNSNTAIVTTLALSVIVPGQLQLSVNAEPGRTYRVEYSTDLRNWTVVGTVNSGHGMVIVPDATATGQARRFYRALQLP